MLSDIRLSNASVALGAGVGAGVGSIIGGVIGGPIGAAAGAAVLGVIATGATISAVGSGYAETPKLYTMHDHIRDHSFAFKQEREERERAGR